MRLGCLPRRRRVAPRGRHRMCGRDTPAWCEELPPLAPPPPPVSPAGRWCGEAVKSALGSVERAESELTSRVPKAALAVGVGAVQSVLDCRRASNGASDVDVRAVGAVGAVPAPSGEEGGDDWAGGASRIDAVMLGCNVQ